MVSSQSSLLVDMKDLSPAEYYDWLQRRADALEYLEKTTGEGHSHMPWDVKIRPGEEKSFFGSMRRHQSTGVRSNRWNLWITSAFYAYMESKEEVEIEEKSEKVKKGKKEKKSQAEVEVKEPIWQRLR